MNFSKLETELDVEVLEWLTNHGYPIERVERDGDVIYRTPAMINHSKRVNETKQVYENGLLSMEIISGQIRSGIYKSNGLIIDLDTHTIFVEDEKRFLSKAEYILLDALLSKPHQSFSRQALVLLLEQAYNHVIQDNTLTVHMSVLRRIVGSECIKTHKTLGYYWNFDVEKIG